MSNFGLTNSLRLGYKPYIPDITSNLLIHYKCDPGDICGNIITNYGSLNSAATTIMPNNTNTPVVSIAMPPTVNGKTIQDTNNRVNINGCVDLSNNAHSIRGPPLNIATGTSMTITLWVYLKSNTNTLARIFRFGGGKFISFQNRASNNNNIIQITNIGGFNSYYTQNTLITEKWYHMAVVFDVTNNITQLYINNVVVSFDVLSPTPAVCGNLTTDLSNIWIGGDDYTYYTNFAFSDYRIYNRALNSTEISMIYNYVKPVPSTVVADSMLLYVPFDNSTDFSGNTVANYATGQPVYNLNLIVDNTLKLNTTGQRVGIGCLDSSNSSVYTGIRYYYDFSGNTGPFTLSVWFKTSSAGISGAGTFLDLGGSIFFRFIGTGLQVGHQKSLYSASGYNDGTWHHVVYVIPSTGTCSIYIDGVTKTTTLVNPFPLLYQIDASVFYAKNITIANSTFATGVNITPRFSGFIDDVRVYTRVLTAAEIMTIYNNANISITENLLVYYKCNPGDISGGTVTNYGTLNSTQTSILPDNTSIPIYTISTPPTVNGNTLANMMGCIDLSNSAHYIKGPVLNIVTNMTVALWFYLKTDTKGYARLFATLSGGWIALTNPSHNNWNTIYITGLGSTVDNYTSTSTPLSYEKWYHIAAVFDVANKKIILYINNVVVTLSGSNACTDILNTNNTTNNSVIGFYGLTNVGNFAFSDYRIYNRALNSTEVSMIYNYVNPLISSVVTDSMLLYLKFDTGDFSGNTVANWATGTAVYNVNLLGNTLPTIDTTNQKVGSGSCVVTDASASIIYPYNFTDYTINNNLTIAFWFKTTNEDTNLKYMCDIGKTMFIRFVGSTLQVGSDNNAYQPGGYDDQNWHHVVLTIPSGGGLNGAVYIDGDNKATVSSGSFLFGDKSDITFCQAKGLGTVYYPFKGNLDDVRVYNRILTAAEVTTIYTNTY
jgi:hypothetical protein